MYVFSLSIFCFFFFFSLCLFFIIFNFFFCFFVLGICLFVSFFSFYLSFFNSFNFNFLNFVISLFFVSATPGQPRMASQTGRLQMISNQNVHFSFKHFVENLFDV